MPKQFDSTIYTSTRVSGLVWAAQILLPGRNVPEQMEGYETFDELLSDLQAKYGESISRVPPLYFQREIEQRMTHTPEMLALLEDTWAGDLRDRHVYASILRPMQGITVEHTIYLNPPQGAKYRNHWTIYTYIAAREPLSERTIEHYDLVPISHPAPAN